MRPSASCRLLIASASLLACSPGPESSSAPLPPAPTPLVETEAATMTKLCEAGETRAWEVLDPEGAVLAVTRGRCAQETDAEAPAPWRVDCQLSQDEQARYELSTWLSDGGRPIAAQLRDGYTTRYYYWQDDRMVESHLGDSRSMQSRAPGATTWMLPSHAVFLREFMLRLGAGRKAGELHQFSYAPDRDALSELHIVPVRDETQPTNAFADLGGAVLAFNGADEGLAGLTIHSLRTAEGVEVYRERDASGEYQPTLPELPQPQYHLGAGLEILAVDIPAAGEEPALGAELIRAEADTSAQNTAQRQPGVLFISGAGAQNRLGFVPEQGVDVGSHEIHDSLARAGFSVLRFDDRGVGQSGIGADATPGFQAQVDDARRAWKALASHPEVDPARITIIGHGEGALAAMLLAQEKIKVGRKKHAVDRLVLLASPGRNLRELIYDEIRRSHGDRHSTEVESVVLEAKRVHDAALSDGDLPASAEPLRDWMREVLVIEPIKELAKVRVPVLALQGGKDFQVSPTKDFGAIAQNILRRGDGSSAERFDELDHLFKPEPGVSNPGHYRDLSRHVDSAVIQSLVTWLSQPAK